MRFIHTADWQIGMKAAAIRIRGHLWGWIPASGGEEPGQPKFANWPLHIHPLKEVQ